MKTLNNALMLALTAEAVGGAGVGISEETTYKPLTSTWGGIAEDKSGWAEFDGQRFTWDAEGRSTGSPLPLARTLMTISEPTLRSLASDDAAKVNSARRLLHPAQVMAASVGRASSNTVTQRDKVGEVAWTGTLKQLATAKTKVSRGSGFSFSA